MIQIYNVLPNDSQVKAIGVKIGDQIYIGIPGGAEIETEFIKKIEEDLMDE